MSLVGTTGVEDPQKEVLLVGRRWFLGSVALIAGAVVATSLVPLSVVHAVAQLPTSPAPGDPGEGTWHVDDMWGHWPRYAHPIGYGHVQTEHVSLLAHADPIDHIFLS
jgi:hypothetical protein